MDKLIIHKEIYDKLDHFIKINKIPNILFHGNNGCGKKTIIMDFINKIYNYKYNKDLVLFVNCSHGKGIKFIRDELKFFAKTNVQTNESNVNFKTVILSNADKLTMDAQSALRRCIELFSHNTRFFVIAEDKYKLMKPILSRFCELYIPEPCYKNKIINLNQYIINETFKCGPMLKKRQLWLQKQLQNIHNIEEITLQLLNEKCVLFYDKGYSSLDVMEIIKHSNKCNFNMPMSKIVEIYVCHNKMRKEIRSEKLLILMILNYIYLNRHLDIKNVSFL